MKESLFKWLIELFALSAVKGGSSEDKMRSSFAQFVERRDISEEQSAVYTADFERTADSIAADVQRLRGAGADPSAFFEQRMTEIARSIVKECEQHSKMWLTLQWIELAGVAGAANDSVTEFIWTFAKRMYISRSEFDNACAFILRSEEEMPLNENLLLIARQRLHPDTPIRFMPNAKMLGRVYILYIESVNMLLLRYFGQRDMFLNGRALHRERAYIFAAGGVLRNAHIDPVYYNKAYETFLRGGTTSDISYVAQNVSYRFPGSKNGVHPFSFHARSGELIAIMGGSGVGKSTLLSLLSGQLKLRTGKICINGHDIRAEKERTESVIGYVPQDELLIEELTVYENLYYNALLCFENHSKEEIAEMVNTTIEQFDLEEARDFKVGNPLKKFISGGQRKRLNMAMELIRQPSVLFVDEPTSGLSSGDSEKIMLLLKKQSLQGKIIVVNIHQPSSDLYKLFNRILIVDHGGHVIFQGNPMDAIVYFKEAANYLNPEESECAACGNVNTDIIQHIVEAHAVNEFGRAVHKRQRSAGEWYRRYMNKINPKIQSVIPPPVPLPASSFKQPKHLRQLLIFFLRNLHTKLANRQYMLLTLLGAPMLALVLGYFTKFAAGTPDNPLEYVFAENNNLPSYLFICVIAVFFFGLNSSAQEIIKDRKALQRERLLHLSRNSYLLSKALWLCIVSAFQTLAIVLIGNSILQIEGLTLSYFILLFSTSVCAGMIGLNLSAGLNSEASIYIFIPLILIPQILFSGVVVQYEKLHRSHAPNDYVPIVAEITPSRWAYEALAVTQFINNRFERNFVKYDEQLSRLSYASSLWIPQVSAALSTLAPDAAVRLDSSRSRQCAVLLGGELTRLQPLAAAFGAALPSALPTDFPYSTAAFSKNLQENLDTLKIRIQRMHRETMRQKDEYSKILMERLGGTQALLKLQKDNHNKSLADILLNRSEVDKIRQIDNKFFQIRDPIFKEPHSQWGRAHFYAAYKKIGSRRIDTLYFNTAVLWLMNFVFYMALYFDLLRKGVQRINKIKLRRIAIRFARAIPH